MDRRRKKALLWAVAAFILCLFPLMARVWLDRHGALERPELGVVGEFVLRDHKDVALTRDQLRRSVTVILYWPALCAAPDACSEALKTAEMTRDWVNKSLKPKWTEENNPLVLAVVGEGANALESFTDWRRFAILPGEASFRTMCVMPYLVWAL